MVLLLTLIVKTEGKTSSITSEMFFLTGSLFAQLWKNRTRTINADRKIYFGPQFGWLDTPVVERLDLNKNPTEGPVLVEEYDSTIVVPPHWKVSIDALKDVVLQRD